MHIPFKTNPFQSVLDDAKTPLDFPKSTFRFGREVMGEANIEKSNQLFEGHNPSFNGDRALSRWLN